MKSLLKCYEAVGDGGETDGGGGGGGANKKVVRVKHTRCRRVNFLPARSREDRFVNMRRGLQAPGLGQTCRPPAVSRVAAAEEGRTINYALSRTGSGSPARCEALQSHQRADMCGSNGLWESWDYELGRTAAGE